MGPLSGKVIIGVLAYAVSFIGFGIAWRGREVNFGRVVMLSLALLAVGFALTFPPIFDVFAPS